MSGLAQLQRDFVAGVFDSKALDVLDDLREDGLARERRLEVYRNNVFSNFRAALADVYPVVERLVGEEFFHHGATRFIQRYPSLSGDLHDFGNEFADFLADFEPARSLPYLPDVARLEWQYHRVFHAADHAALDLARFAQLTPEQYPTLVFKLHPATALLRSEFPLLRIWQVNQDDYDDDQTVDLAAGADHLLLSRQDYVVSIEQLDPAVHALVDAIAQRCLLSDAVDEALRRDANFNLEAALAHLIQRQVLVDFYLA